MLNILCKENHCSLQRIHDDKLLGKKLRCNPIAKKTTEVQKLIILVENISINRAHVQNFIQGALEISDKSEDLLKSCYVTATPQSIILYT